MSNDPPQKSAPELSVASAESKGVGAGGTRKRKRSVDQVPSVGDGGAGGPSGGSRKRQRPVAEAPTGVGAGVGAGVGVNAFSALMTTATAAATERSAAKRARLSRPWVYRPSVISAAESVRLFGELRSLIESTVKEHGQPKVTVRGEQFEQRRVVAYFSRTAAHYTYSGAKPVNAGWPQLLQHLSAVAAETVAAVDPTVKEPQVFDSALCNLYRDGNDTIGMHRDKEAMDGYIVSFSFYPSGSALIQRDFVIYDNDGKRVEVLRLENGSVLTMKPGMQQKYMHALPMRAKIDAARVNITLRQHPALGKLGPSNPKPTSA